ncbi:MAG: amino acid carrier protein, partial [Pseudomonadota bacterium]
MSGASLADRIDQTLSPVSDVVSSIVFVSVDIAGVSMPLVVAWLMAGGVFMTIAFRFLNLTGFRHAWSVVARRRDDHKGDGEITHFEALSAALSGTVGLGNIASVPVAIVLGGPGAIFWMVLAGFFGMTLKFAECTMAVKYRRVQSDGRVIGGPMYYIEAAFERIGAKAVGKGAALFFAVMTVGASISLFQINQSHAQFANVTGLAAPVAYGVIMSSLVALVVLGGVRRVGRVASMLVPFMAVIYVAAGLFIIMANITALPGAIALIFESAFGLDAAGGGIIGALINGMKRATYSSEAGVGSAAIVHASVKTDNPLTEGHVALLEPFIDTV